MSRVSNWNRGLKWVLAGVSFWNPAFADGRAGAEAEARASAQGDASARVVGEASLDMVALRLGGESAAGIRAPLRHALIAGSSLSIDEWGASIEARIAPDQE